MELKGSAAYEDELFFQNYMKRRHRKDSPNEIIEKPALLKMIGDVSGKDVLDLGCGDASMRRDLLQAASYLGVDGSKNMIMRAEQNLSDLENSEVIHSSLESFPFPVENYHLIFSQLALHYLEDFRQICENIYNSLRFGGKFVFSVQHPVITSAFKSNGTKRTDWIVDDYFQIGVRAEPWIGEKVVKYHRTVEEYFMILRNSGFHINELCEATPDRRNFSSEEEYKRRNRIPLFLLFSCEKPVCEYNMSIRG